MLYLGVLARGLETGRYRAWAAVLLALTALCHLIPLFFALAGTVVWFALQLDWGKVRLWMWARSLVAASFGGAAVLGDRAPAGGSAAAGRSTRAAAVVFAGLVALAAVRARPLDLQRPWGADALRSCRCCRRRPASARSGSCPSTCATAT